MSLSFSSSANLPLRVMSQVWQKRSANADCTLVAGELDIVLSNRGKMQEQDVPPRMLKDKQTTLHLSNAIANVDTDASDDIAASYVLAPALEPTAASLRPIIYGNHSMLLSEPQLQDYTEPPVPAPALTPTFSPQSTSIITLASPNSSLLLLEEDETRTARARDELFSFQQSLLPSAVDPDQSYLEEERRGRTLGFPEEEGVELSHNSVYVTATTTTTEELPAYVSPNELSAPTGEEYGRNPTPVPEKNEPSYFDIPLQIPPAPRRERDTIHGIVAQYAESHGIITDEGRGSWDDRGTSDTCMRGRGSVDSARSCSYGGVVKGEEGQYNDIIGQRDGHWNGQPETDREGEAGAEEEGEENGVLRSRVPGMIFNLTPGREPSPARYKHGEPLHFGKSRISLSTIHSPLLV